MHLAVCGTSGRILRFLLSAGQRSDCLFGPLLAAGLRPRATVADRAYDTEAMVTAARACDAVLVVPSRRNRRRPRALYTAVYRRRNIVERIIGRLKDHRRLATRYDKTDANFKAFFAIAAALFNLNTTANTA